VFERRERSHSGPWSPVIQRRIERPCAPPWRANATQPRRRWTFATTLYPRGLAGHETHRASAAVARSCLASFSPSYTKRSPGLNTQSGQEISPFLAANRAKAKPPDHHGLIFAYARATPRSAFRPPHAAQRVWLNWPQKRPARQAANLAYQLALWKMAASRGQRLHCAKLAISTSCVPWG